MKVLLDTNIVIHRESVVIDPDIGVLFRWLEKLNYIKCVHPISIKEIEKHKDAKIVQKMKIILENYYILKTQAPLCNNIKNFIDNNDKDDKEKNDSILLNELCCERVDYIITEDRGIHYKASLLKLSHKVFTIDTFLEKVTVENPDFVDYKVLSAKREYFGNINLQDKFFDSLKRDYDDDGFKQWFNKKSDETAYICETDGNITAFLYIKKEDETEDYSDIEPVFDKKKRLKIGTFKVESNGLGIGERFLKIIFENAIRQKAEEIYVTMFNKNNDHERLIRLLEEWGFFRWGRKTSEYGKEEVYVRDLRKKIDNNFPKKTYPFFSMSNNIFIVPIRPEWHTELLPDSILRTESFEDYKENKPIRNYISKIYVSHSRERNLKLGDLIIFYRTGGRYISIVTTIGIVENVITNIKNEEHFKNLCKKRSVFTDEQLSIEWNRYPSNKPFIVNFLYTYSFPKRPNLERLIELGVISDITDAPRGFRKINKEDFTKIINETNSDNSYIID